MQKIGIVVLPLIVCGVIVDVHDVAQRSDSATHAELYHPGTQPVFITRLNRRYFEQDDDDEEATILSVRAGESGKRDGGLFRLPLWSRKVLDNHQKRLLGRGIGIVQDRAVLHNVTVVSPDVGASQRSDLVPEAELGPKDMIPLELLRSEYMGKLAVGTNCTSSAPSADCTEPQSRLTVVFDTGSTNMWLSSDLDNENFLIGRSFFNHTESLTFRFINPVPDCTPKSSSDCLPPDTSAVFGTAELAGPLGTDKVAVGSLFVQQTFGLIRSAQGNTFKKTPIEGICGLALPSQEATASAGNSKPFFESVIQERLLQRNEFAFYMSRDDPSVNALMWGGADERFHEGPIEWFPVVDPLYWSVELHSLSLGNTTFEFTETDGNNPNGIPGDDRAKSETLSNSHAVFDSGTSVLGITEKVALVLLKAVGQVPRADVLKVPDMVFTFRSKSGEHREFHLAPERYLASVDADGPAVPAVVAMNLPQGHGIGVVLGELFMQEYFTVFSRGDGDPAHAEIGLAKSRATGEVAEHLEMIIE